MASIIKEFDIEWNSAEIVHPQQKVYHVANPVYRDVILEIGLTPQQGNCHDSYNYPPAIFISNVPDIDHPEMFDSTYDDDIWEIDLSGLDNEFRQDINYNTDHYCFTLKEIPASALTLIKQGTGADNF